MCEITAGYSKPSCASVAGLKSIVAINVKNVDFTVVGGMVTAYTRTHQAFRLSLDVNSGYANQTPTGSRENNSIVYMQEVMAMLKDSELTTDQLIDTLSTGYFVLIAEMRNGKNKVLGITNGMRATTANMNSGQAGGDLNGSTIVWAGEEDAIAPHISNEFVEQLLVFPS